MFESVTFPQDLCPSDPRFGVGPSLIPLNHLEKLAATGIELLGTSHRKPAVKNLVKEVQEGLASYFSLPSGYEVVLGNGGATFLFDALALGLTLKKSAHFVCGEFSDKWYKAHASVPWLEAEKIEVDYGRGLTPTLVEGSDLICATLNETSTGVIIDSCPKGEGDVLIAIDATSGGGQVPIDMENVDVYFFSPQKVFASEGGTWIAFMSPRAIERALHLADDEKRYIPEIMNLKLAIENSRKNQTYNTPAVCSFFLLNEQIKKMNAVGLKEVINNGRKKADMIYGWAKEKNYLSVFVEQEQYRSPVVATIDMDERYNAADLAKRLRDLGLAYDIDAYRKLGRNQLRISLFYNVAYDDLVKLTKLIDHAIESTS